jgi:glutamate racemase
VTYYGDTARVPYGPKSPETVRRYSQEIATYLVDQGVKMMVVACNTATAHALPSLRDSLTIPVIGVVEPGARAAVRATRNGHVGVIGTAGTVKSGAYERALRALEPSLRVTARACPLFVPLVEEGWVDHDATRLVAEEYLAPLLSERVDTLVLGCTHYPLLKHVIAEVLDDSVCLIDSAEETARETASVLENQRLTVRPSSEPTHRFIASDDPLMFLQLGQRFLGDAIESVEVKTLG